MTIHLQLGPLSRLYAITGGLHGDPDPEFLRAAVLAWQRALSGALPQAVHWDESPTAPFDSATVGDAAWLRLLREAAGSEAGLPELRAWALERPAEPTAQLILPDLWLPGTDGLMFQTRDLNEQPVWVGSSRTLLEFLEDTKLDSGEPGWILATYARRSEAYAVPLARRSE